MHQRNTAFTTTPLTSTSRHAQPQHYQDIDDNIHIDDSTSDSPAATPTAKHSTANQTPPKPSSGSGDGASAAAAEEDYSWLHDYALFLHHNSDPHSHNDRRISEHEQLITLLHHLQQQGQTAQYRLYFKQLAAVNDSDDDDDTLQQEEKEEAEEDAAHQLYQQQCKRFHAQHVGYLDRRMSGSSWKERWFVLQQSKLYTYKSHTSNPLTPLSSISIADSIIAPLPLYSSLSLTSPTGSSGGGGGGSCFEINTQQKIYYFRTKTAQAMDDWVLHLRQHTRVERDNEDIERLQFDIEKVAEVESVEDERRRREMSVGVEGVLTDESGCEWLCKLAMEQRQTRELLCWMDVQVWFFVQRRAKLTSGGGMNGGGAGSVSGSGTGPNSRRGSVGDGSSGGRRDSVLGEFRRRRASSASQQSASPDDVGSNSASPARSNSLMRRPSFNAATLTYLASTPPNAASSHSHTKLTRRRSSSSASSAGQSSNSTVPPSSYLPTLSTTLIYTRYIESGSEMEVDIPEQVRTDYQDMLAPPSPSSHSAEPQQSAEREAQVMQEVEAALRDRIAEQLYAAWQLDCMQYALMRLPVAGGTMYAHHPWRFVLREKRREEREEREREEEERRREEEEEAELRRRMEHVKKERRRSASGFIRPQRADEDGEEHKASAGGAGAGAGHSRRASLTHRVASKALMLI